MKINKEDVTILLIIAFIGILIVMTCDNNTQHVIIKKPIDTLQNKINNLDGTISERDSIINVSPDLLPIDSAIDL